MGDDLLKWSVRDYFMDAALCQMMIDLTENKGDLSNARDALEKYKDISDIFNNTPQAKFLENLLEHLEKMEPELVSELVINYTKTGRLNDWRTNIIYEMRAKLTGEGGTGAAEDSESFDPLGEEDTKEAPKAAAKPKEEEEDEEGFSV